MQNVRLAHRRGVGAEVGKVHRRAVGIEAKVDRLPDVSYGAPSQLVRASKEPKLPSVGLLKGDFSQEDREGEGCFGRQANRVFDADRDLAKLASQLRGSCDLRGY